jgi:hypothetical protein
MDFSTLCRLPGVHTTNSVGVLAITQPIIPIKLISLQTHYVSFIYSHSKLFLSR